MPIIKSAIKKIRKDKKRTIQNTTYTVAYKEMIKKIKKGGSDTKKLLQKVYSLVDKAVKRNVIHKNKGNRLKSRVTQLVKKIK